MTKKHAPDSKEPLGDQKPTAQSQKKKRFVTRSVSLGRPLVPNLDNVAEVLEMIEDEEKWRRGLKASAK
jgi:hypothetical protein